MTNEVSAPVRSQIVQAGSIGSVTVVGTPATVLPRQLPAAVGNFSGRAAQLAALDEAVGGGTAVVSALKGTAGIGKTALALHWAHLVADDFPDGQLYVNMRGFEPVADPVTPGEAMRGFLDAFGIPPERIPVDFDAQAALFRSIVADRRVLVVLDNVKDAGQVWPLLPGSATCSVVVTSRDELPSLVARYNARPIQLDLLSTDEAVVMLRDRIGDRADAEPGALVELVRLCARLPLALTIVAARAVLAPQIPLSVLAGELRAERLSALDMDDNTGVRAAISWSTRALTPATAGFFRLLGLHRGPDIDLRAAAALGGVDLSTCLGMLRELTAAHLLEEYRHGRYRFHDLLRVFAQESVLRNDSAKVRDAALRRVFDYYLHSAWAGDRALVAKRVPIEPPRGDSVLAVMAFDGPAEAGAWFENEHAVLMGVVDEAVEQRFHRHAWQLALAMRSFLDTRGHWRDYESVYRSAMRSADRLGDPLAQSRVHRGLGRALSRLARWDEADAVLGDAVRYARQSGDRLQQAHCHEALSWLYGEWKRPEAAVFHALEALKLHPKSDDAAWRGFALNIAGRGYAALGDLEVALDFSTNALALHQSLTDREDKTGEAEALNTLGHICCRLGRLDTALDFAEQALALHQHLGNRPGQAEAFEVIGDVHHALGGADNARSHWQSALQILEQLNRVTLSEVRQKLADLG